MAIGGEHDNSSVLEEGFIKDLINNGDKVVLVVLKKSQRMEKVSDMIRTEVGLEPVLIHIAFILWVFVAEQENGVAIA